MNTNNDEQVGLDQLDATRQPPPELVDRIVGRLHQEQQFVGTHKARRRVPIRAIAASVMCLAIGFLAGQQLQPAAVVTTAQQAFIDGSSNDLYALMLYEPEGFETAEPDEMRLRYDAYSRWVGKAYATDQFVAGQELAVDQGWLLQPDEQGAVEPRPTVDPRVDDARLSGMFFVRGDSDDAVLALARQLPHVEHGGIVIVQKTIPTSTPPETI